MTDKEPTTPTKTTTKDYTKNSKDYDNRSPDSPGVVSSPSSPDSQIVSPEFKCDICGKTFSRSGSLVGHKIKAHKIAPEKRVAPRGEGKGKAPKYIPPLTTETQVPDSLSLLKNNLVIYGLSDRDANAVTTSMMNYDVDDVYELDRQLRGINMPNNRRVMLLESWINARNIEIPQNLARQIGLIEPQRQSWRRTYHVGGGPYEEEEGKSKIGPMADLAIAEYYDKKAGRLEAPPSNDSNPQLTAVLGEQAELRKQNEKLLEKIDTMEKDALKQSLLEMRSEMKEMRSGLVQSHNQYSAVIEGVRSIKELASDYISLAKAVVGVGRENLPKREVIVGESKLLEMLPEDITVEE